MMINKGMIVFPTDLAEGILIGRPFVKFKVKERGVGPPIYMPIPQGVTFNDGGDYSTIDMGAMGASLRGSGVDVAETRGLDGMRSIGSAMVNNIVSTAVAGALTMKQSAMEALMGDTQTKLMAATKLVPNPSRNVTFSGNKIRSFNFSFKLVGRTPAESKAITQIHNQFRLNIYPEATPDAENILLNYPPTWEIAFYDGWNGGENRFLPKIAPCYLTDFTTNFNPSAMMWKVDGSATEIDMSLTFQETRTQMRFDIDSLEAPAGPVEATFEQQADQEARAAEMAAIQDEIRNQMARAANVIPENIRDGIGNAVNAAVSGIPGRNSE